MSGGAQLPLEGLPLDPRALAGLSIFERIALDEELKLDPAQRKCAEQAARLIVRGEYLRGAR